VTESDFTFSSTGGDVEIWRDSNDGRWRVSERGKSEIFENLEAAILHLINSPRPKKPALRLVKNDQAEGQA
jgi:hypothetical protein